MYQLTEKIKKQIVKECFDDICKNAQKEEAGAFKGLVNSVIKANIYLDEEKSVAVVNQKHGLATNYIYKLIESKQRIQILQKLEEPYIFSIELNGEKLQLECEQYSCRILQ